jgi:4-hydroxy-tetrahydrodipicolinate synthase
MAEYNIYRGSDMTLFRGCGVALVTPFQPDGEVSQEVLRELIEFQISEGTDAIIVCGSTGEAAAMSPDEQGTVIEVSVNAVAGRVPLIAGVGGSGTAAVVGLARTAARAGADALLVSAPPYNKPSQAGMIAHFEAIIDAVDLPVILYNVPGRTASNILPETVERLADHSRVVGIKEACGDISQVADLCRRVADRIAVYSGNDDQVVPLMALGGVGVISVLANVAPRDTAAMVRLFLEGDLERSRRLQLRYLPLIQALFREPNPVPVKAAVRALGFEVGDARLPLLNASDETVEILRARMREVGIAVGVAV